MLDLGYLIGWAIGLIIACVAAVGIIVAIPDLDGGISFFITFIMGFALTWAGGLVGSRIYEGLRDD